MYLLIRDSEHVNVIQIVFTSQHVSINSSTGFLSIYAPLIFTSQHVSINSQSADLMLKQLVKFTSQHVSINSMHRICRIFE